MNIKRLWNRNLSLPLVTQLRDYVLEPSSANSLTTRRSELVYILGPSGSGKSYLSSNLKSAIEAAGQTCALLSTDGYTTERVVRHASGLHGYDPATYQIDALISDLTALVEDQVTTIVPKYDQTTGCFVAGEILEPSEYLIIEGVATASKLLRERHPGSLIFIDAPLGEHVNLRIAAVVNRRKCTPDDASPEARDYPRKFVEWIQPAVADADVIVPYAEIRTAIDTESLERSV